MTAADHRRWEQRRIDRDIIDEASVWLRDRAVQEQYAGWQRPERAFAVAALLDTMSLQIDVLPDGVRWEAVRAAMALLGDRGPAPRAPRR